MKKLIQTNFTYTVPSNIHFRGRIAGSYLGRKPATEKTIRRFLRINGTPPVESVRITGSHESQWIHR